MAVPARLVTNQSLVKAEMTTVLPIRAGGRVALAMLLTAIPYRGSSVRTRLVKSEEGRNSSVEILNRQVSIAPLFPIQPDLVDKIDALRELISKVLTLDLTISIDHIDSLAASLLSASNDMLLIANMDPLEPEEAPQPIEKKIVDHSTDASRRVFELRMDAIMAEVQAYWEAESKSLSLPQMEYACETIWDMYHTRI